MGGNRRVVEYVEVEDTYNGSWNTDLSADAGYHAPDEGADNDDRDSAYIDRDSDDANDVPDEDTLPHIAIKHENLRYALIRQEDACRTEEDFKKLTATWDRLDRNREQREQRYEKASVENMLEFELQGQQTVIPRPIDHEWWRELLGGNFIDTIHDCPLEVAELASSRNVNELVGALKDTQKEVLYYRAIRYWSNQQIAAMRSQTDRNILKTYVTTIEGLRYKLYMRLLPRFRANAPLTIAQVKFVQANASKYGDGNPPRKRRIKAAIDGGSDK